MDTLESTKENLLLCNKAPQNLVALNSTYYLTVSLCQESGHRNLDAVSQVSHKAIIQAGVVILSKGSNGGRSASEFTC